MKKIDKILFRFGVCIVHCEFDPDCAKEDYYISYFKRGIKMHKFLLINNNRVDQDNNKQTHKKNQEHQ